MLNQAVGLVLALSSESIDVFAESDSKHPRLVLAVWISAGFWLSGCNVESSDTEKLVTQSSCATALRDPTLPDFWNCDARKALLASIDLQPKEIHIRLRDGEFSMWRHLGHLSDPEFEDLMIVSDALPGLVRIICRELPDRPVVESTSMAIEARTVYVANFPIRRVINEDPEIYEWRADAVDVYRALGDYC